MKKWVCVGGFLWLFGLTARSQVVGDYQSVGIVDLSNASNWNVWNGTVWETATLPPDGNVAATNTITILPSHQWNNSSSSIIPVGVSLINQGTTGTFTTSAANKVVVNGTYVHNTSSSISTIMPGMTISTGSLFIYRGNNSLTPAVSFSNRTYYDLRIESTSGNLSLNLAGFSGGTNPFTVNGNFTIGQNVTLNQNTFTGTINLNGDVSIAGTLNIHGFSIAPGKTMSISATGIVNIPSGEIVTINGTADAGVGKFTGDGSLLINGVFKSAHVNGIGSTGNCQQTGGLNFGIAGLVEFNGTGSQLIAQTSLANLKINSAGIVSLASDLVITGNVVMTSGKLRLEGFNLTVGGSASGSSSSYVQTNGIGSLILQNITVTGTAPVGNSSYNPVQLSNGEGFNWSFRVTDSIEPAGGYTNQLKSIQRTWHIHPSGTSTGADIVFGYDDSDPLQRGSNFLTSQDVQVWHYHNANWSTVSLALTPTGLVSGGTRTVTLRGQQEFSEFTIANLNTILPLTLHSFTAVADNSSVKLSFINDAEYAIEKYFIERVENGAFTVIASISPLKNDGTAVKYNYRDHPPHYRRHTYRVRALEWNGNTVYSNIFNLDPVEVDNIILVKNGNEYFWKTHLTEGNYLIRVYNISGKLIIEERFGHRTGEAAGNFCIRQPGWYILVIQGKEKYSRMFTNY
jgi:hypothetical protein